MSLVPNRIEVVVEDGKLLSVEVNGVNITGWIDSGFTLAQDKDTGYVTLDVAISAQGWNE